VLGACDSCEGDHAKSDAGAGPRAPGDAAFDAMLAPRDAGEAGARARAPAPLTPEQAQAAADFVHAVEKAESAKEPKAALAAAEAALAARPGDPRGLAARGRAKLALKDFAGASTDLSRALQAARTPSEAQSLWLALGEALDGRGDADGARLAYARALEQGPSDAAEKRLNMRPKCGVEVERERAPAIVVGTWLAGWDALVESFKKDFGPVDAKKPESDPATKDRLCIEGCGGKGPWIVRMANELAAKHYFVTPVDGPKLVFYEIDGGWRSACAPDERREHEILGHDFHVHVTRTFYSQAIVPMPDSDARDAGSLIDICKLPPPSRDAGADARADAAGADASHLVLEAGSAKAAEASCGLVCRPGAWEELDYYFDPITRARMLRVVEWGLSDASGGHKRKLLLTFDKSNAKLTGDNCDDRLPLGGASVRQK
jgi:hypothetical protein